LDLQDAKNKNRSQEDDFNQKLAEKLPNCSITRGSSRSPFKRPTTAIPSPSLSIKYRKDILGHSGVDERGKRKMVRHRIKAEEIDGRPVLEGAFNVADPN
jgi:hypothetical protein